AMRRRGVLGASGQLAASLYGRRDVGLPRYVAGRLYSTGGAAPLKKTSLNALHRERGGKMVPFCGGDMPVQYTESIIETHLHTRTKAGLFDVSHMGQLMYSLPFFHFHG